MFFARSVVLPTTSDSCLTSYDARCTHVHTPCHRVGRQHAAVTGTGTEQLQTGPGLQRLHACSCALRMHARVGEAGALACCLRARCGCCCLSLQGTQWQFSGLAAYISLRRPQRRCPPPGRPAAGPSVTPVDLSSSHLSCFAAIRPRLSQQQRLRNVCSCTTTAASS